MLHFVKECFLIDLFTYFNFCNWSVNCLILICVCCMHSPRVYYISRIKSKPYFCFHCQCFPLLLAKLICNKVFTYWVFKTLYQENIDNYTKLQLIYTLIHYQKLIQHHWQKEGIALLTCVTRSHHFSYNADN